ncbi:MAG: hypothetical protein JW789_04225 [Candidatus Aenigmarchaeota archaeon]|nr:hypothetical protein [Candidatus Aenigmarchaeota archaeon]
MKLLTYPNFKTFDRMYFDMNTGRGVAVPDGMFPFAFEIDPETLLPVEEAVAYEMDSPMARGLLIEHLRPAELI